MQAAAGRPSVVGVDAAKGGWVAVELVATEGVPSGVGRMAWFGSFLDVVSAFPTASVIAVDMPIGLPAAGRRREADDAARRFVGPRGSSVFATPSRELLDAETYGDARAIAVRRMVPSLSAQAYALAPRIREVAVVVAAPGGERVVEVHPEVSFRQMKGAVLRTKKRDAAGVVERFALLAQQGIAMPDPLPELPDVAMHDLLDAAAAAWSAGRVAAGEAKTLPEEPPIDPVTRRPVAIWY
jgi:predicted RNase H-like nuclease